MPDSTTPAPPPVYDRAQLRKKVNRKLKRRLLTVGLVIGGVAVLVVGAGIGYGVYRNGQISRIVVNGLRATPPSGVENILLVGSTSRCALKQQNPIYGLCSQGVNGVNSDVVMILHLDPTTKTASILSIPRDLFVPNARSTGPNKIDAALYQGPQQLVAAVEQDFGIPVQHFVELNFDSFAGVVQALGGIDMYFPEPVYDAFSQLNIPTAGCRHLNGFQALAVVRARHLQYKGPGVKTNNHAQWPSDPQSDLSRIRRDHEFLRVLASAVSKRGLDNPLTDNSLLGAVAPQLQVDSSFGLGDMLGTVLTFHGVDPQSAPQLTLPVMVDNLSYYDGGYDYGSVVLGSEPGDMQTIDRFLGVSADTDTATGDRLPGGQERDGLGVERDRHHRAGRHHGRRAPGARVRRGGHRRHRGGGHVGVGDDGLLRVAAPAGRRREGRALTVRRHRLRPGADGRRGRRHRRDGLELLGERTPVVDDHVGRLDPGGLGADGILRAGGAEPTHAAPGAVRPPVVHGVGRRRPLTRG